MVEAREIANELRRLVETGELAPGERIPSIAKLAEQFGVNPNTASKGVQQLKRAGVLEGGPGGRARVRMRPHVRRHGMERYSRSRWQDDGKAVLAAEAEQQGHSADQLIRELADVDAPDEVAQRLQLDPASRRVWVRRRTTRINGVPNQLADSFYPLGVVAHAPALRRENTGSGGGFARLDEAGYELAEIEEELAARMPTSDEIEGLTLSPGTPVVELWRTVYTADGRPVEVMRAVLASDQARFHYRFPFPD